MAADVRLGRPRAGLQPYEGLRRLAAIRVLDADDRHLLDRRMLIDRLFDPARIDIVARANNQVLDAVDDEDEPFPIHDADIARAQEIAEELIGGFLWLLPEASHDLWALDANLALFAD